MAEQMCLLRTPGVERAPAYVDSLKAMGEFYVDDFGGDIVGVRPREGAGELRDYVQVHRIADAATDLSDPSTWTVLRERPPRTRGKPDAIEYRDEMIARAKEIQARQPGKFEVDSVAMALMILGAAEVGEVPELLAQQIGPLFEQFPNGSLLYVTVEDALLSRAAFGRTQLALQLTPDMPMGEDAEALSAFSGMTITQGIDFSEMMNLPLLALSPATLGIAFPALPNAVIFLFGDDVELQRPYPISLASLYRPRVLADPEGLHRGELFAEPDPAAGEQVVRWWCARLNEIYSRLYDPTQWMDAEDYFDAPAQTAWLVTFERFVADATSLLAEPQASDLQRLQIAFDLLDKAPQLLGYSRKKEPAAFEALLSRSRCAPVVRDGLAKHLPPKLATRISNECDRLFEGLYAHVIEDTLAYRRDPESVRVATKDPAVLHDLDYETVVARVCRAVRNSSHGLLGLLKDGREDRYLLAAHTGGLPAELTALAPLIALGLLGDPEGMTGGALRERLSPS